MNVPGDERRRRIVPLRDARVAELLGGIPITTLYDWAREKPPRMPGVVRIGRRVLMDLDILEQWLDEQVRTHR